MAYGLWFMDSTLFRLMTSKFQVQARSEGCTNLIVQAHDLFPFFACSSTLPVWFCEESGSRAFFPDSQKVRYVLSDDVGVLITKLVAMGSLVPGSTSESAVRALSISSLSNEPSTSGLQVPKTQTSSVKIRFCATQPHFCGCHGSDSHHQL